MPHKDPITRLEYHREWRRKHAQDPQAKKYPQTPPSRAARRAHWRVKYALKTGRLVRPSECSTCGREAFIEAAHQDYTRPLDVRWLCHFCHRAWDAQHPKDLERIKEMEAKPPCLAPRREAWPTRRPS